MYATDIRRCPAEGMQCLAPRKMVSNHHACVAPANAGSRRPDAEANIGEAHADGPQGALREQHVVQRLWMTGEPPNPCFRRDEDEETSIHRRGARR